MSDLSLVEIVLGFLGGVTFCWGAIFMLAVVVALKISSDNKTTDVQALKGLNEFLSE